jgi:glycosyltransferase involved in cell wall biosynthesis
MLHDPAVTIVIPAYNEQDGIAASLGAVEHAIGSSGWRYEIIVVDDGSTDATARLASEHGAEVVRLGANRGYGAALKAGIAQAKFDWVAIIDADGTYPATALPELLQRVESNDMVVGARIGSQVRDPFARRPAKWVLRKFASILAGEAIPDLNSGLRVIRKSLVQKFSGILPSGFSFTTTITLALICCGYSVDYVPIDYFKRIGRSKIKPSHAFKFAFLILRTIMLFRPMRILVPVGSFVILAGLVILAFDLRAARVSVSAAIILLEGIVIWCVALVSWRNARLRQSKR